MTTLKQLEEIVLAHTEEGSRHRAAALIMLGSHWQRFDAEIKSITCAECGKTLRCVRWTEKSDHSLVDTWGYVEWETMSCHECLDEGYIGDILMPKKP